MEKLDLTTIINRVRMLSTATPVSIKGHDDTEREVDSSMLAGVIIGAAIGCHCPIPNSAVPIATVYFSQTFAQEVNAVLSKINEAVNIRTQVAYDAAVSMWVDRYDMVHKPCDLDAIMVRIATSSNSGFSNENFVRPLLAGLNEEQRESLEKIVRSMNLTCSKIETTGIFASKY